MLTPQTVLRVLGITATVLFSGFAAAQVGGSVIVESDYRFRGISLSGGDPTAHLNLAYDHASGWYTGASLTGTELKPGSRKTALTAYLGYASRRGDLGAWEAGAVLNRFFGVTYYDYDEVYAGFIAERWTARVYYSPDYFGRSVRTMYAELNGNLPLTAQLRAFAHLGVLARLSGNVTPGGGQTRYDARIGLGLRIADFDASLAWVDSNRGRPYVAAYDQSRSTAVLSASYDF